MRKVIRRVVLLIILIMFCINFSGCFNYRDVNRTVFTTTFLLDYDTGTETVTIFIEAFRAARGAAAGTEKGQRLLFKGSGKTVFEAIRDANLASSYKINYTQNKAVIFTEKMASKGLKKVIDMIDRDQEFLIRPYVFVFTGDPEKLMKVDVKEEEYLGTYLFNLVQNVGSSSRAIVVTMNEYLSKRLMGSKSDVITILRMKKEQLEDKVELNGGAVIVGDQLVEIMRRQEIQGYNFLINEVKTGTLEVTNPFNKDKYVTLEILDSNTKTSIKYEKGKFKLIKDVEVIVTLGESQGGFILNEESVKKLTENAEKNIKIYSTQVFNEYRDKGIDIFELEEEVQRHYPKLKTSGAISLTDVEVKVKVRLEGSSDKTNASM